MKKSVIIFLLLLIISNLYLLKEGFWLYMDASWWPKTSRELFIMVNQQFYLFTNYGYYPGFDWGLFSFTRVGMYAIISVLFWLFGADGSQAALSILGQALTVLSFYFFAGIFFEDKRVRFALALLYTFNPLVYALEGHTYYQLITPLFIYSLYGLFVKKKSISFSYLLLTVCAGYFFISYVRFIQSNAFLIIPYIIYLMIRIRYTIQPLKLGVYLLFNILAFLPVIYAFAAQILTKQETAFYYASVFGQSVSKQPFVTAFNFFPSVTVRLYEHPLWILIGLVFFVYFLLLVFLLSHKSRGLFFHLNMFLLLFGITIYSLANIFGNTIYFSLLQFFPFVTNNPFFALYVAWLPFVLLLGIVTQQRIRHLYYFVVPFILIGLIPLLNFRDIQLKQLPLSQVPLPYIQYFVNPPSGVHEATHYIYHACWRSQYMNNLIVSTPCLNFGIFYTPILLNDPRLLAGEDYLLSQRLYGSGVVNDLRITHNLKNVILPKDIVSESSTHLFPTKDQLQNLKDVEHVLDANTELEVITNEHFNHYYFRNKSQYDFFIYSPKQLIARHVSEINSENTDITMNPVFVDDRLSNEDIQQVQIDYKIAENNPTLYYLKISGVDQDKKLMVVFNQAFHPSWKIKLISKSDYDDLKCSDDVQYFPLTNNRYCSYDSRGFALDVSPKDYGELSNSHVKANFINNGWIIDLSNIPLDGTNEVYAIIVYEKQVWYTYSIWIALGSIVLLVILAISDFRKRFR